MNMPIPQHCDHQMVENDISKSSSHLQQTELYRQSQRKRFSQYKIARNENMNEDDEDETEQKNSELVNDACNEDVDDCERVTFRGLSNQGATCYMNSLLQTLYMTPEFRQGLYEWQAESVRDASIEPDQCNHENDSDTSSNIPYQLQKLFAELQLSSQRYVDTKALTDSFGWNSSDVFQQHDVQELCRVLFDALERSFQGTCKADFVNELYRGTLKDYVQCCCCGHESSRMDHFLDLSLVIRPFGVDCAGLRLSAIQSLEAALELFLKPEVLESENQWHCERCQTKQNAIKGLKFFKLPYLLSLQLKRFDFDYTTMDRIKLHDRIIFPKFLNMNVYIAHDEDKFANGTTHLARKGELARRMSLERHELEKMQRRKLNQLNEPALPPSPIADEELTCHIPVGKIEPAFAKEDELSLQTWDPEFDVNSMFADGPYVYELYSVLIHSGSALGGHYFAYIKSFENRKWYNFNDSHVTEISEQDIRAAFGGEKPTTGGSQYVYRSTHSTCAYMLMYRLVSESQNVNSVADIEIPMYLRQLINEAEARFREEERRRQERIKQVAVKVYMFNKHGQRIEKELLLYKNVTLVDALKQFVEEFAQEPSNGLSSRDGTIQVRLRDYNSFSRMVTRSYEHDESKSLSALRIHDGHHFMLETKPDFEDWEPYVEDNYQILVSRYPASLDVGGDTNFSQVLFNRWIQLDQDATIGTLYEKILKKFFQATKDDFPYKIRLLKKGCASYPRSNITILNAADDEQCYEKTLLYHAIGNGTEIIFETCTSLLDASPAFEKYVKEENMILINVRYDNNGESNSCPIHIDQRDSFPRLKEAIAANIGVAPEQFKLLRMANSLDTEIKTSYVSLQSMSITNNCTIYVVPGQPLREGEYQCRLMQYFPEHRALFNDMDDYVKVNGPTDDNFDGLTFSDLSERVLKFGHTSKSIQPTDVIVVKNDMDIRDLRLRVFQKLIQTEVDGFLTPPRIRLREMYEGHFTRILIDGHELEMSSPFSHYDGGGIAYEILDEPETLAFRPCVLTIAVFDQNTYTFPCKKRKEFMYNVSHDHSAIVDEEEKQRITTYLEQTIGSFCEIPNEFLRFARLSTRKDCIDVLEASDYTFHTADTMASILLPLKDTEILLAADARYFNKTLPDNEHKELVKCVHEAMRRMKQHVSIPTAAVENNSRLFRKYKPKEAALVIRSSKFTSIDSKQP